MKKKVTNPNRRWVYIGASSALLAVLTVIVCIMSGVFSYSTKTHPYDTPAPLATPEYTPPVHGSLVPSEPTPGVTSSAVSYEISAVAGRGGFISPAGRIDAPEGSSVTFTISASGGYEIADVVVDGVYLGARESYTFSDIGSDHSIYVYFTELPVETETPPPETEPPETPKPASPSDLGG